jgi:hypothetical protein
MIREIDLFGVYLPPMLAYAAGTAVLWLLLRRLISSAGFYRFVWHPPLFNAALFVLILAVIVVIVFR